MKALGIGIGASIFGGWLLYSSGISYLLMSTIFYAVGIPFYYAAHKDDLKAGKHIFTKWERILAVFFVISAGIAIMLMLEGKITP